MGFSSQRGVSRLAVILLLLALVLVIGAYFYHKNQQEKAAVAQFLTEKVRRGDLVHEVSASGMVYPKKIVDVGAQVSGEVSKMHVVLGQDVEEGDLIAEIDARTQENELQSAQAQLDSRMAALDTAKAQLNEAQLAYNRADRLLKTGSGTREAQESAYAALVSAKNSVASAQASVREQEITVATASLNLGYTRVLAPMSGRVIALAVEEGQNVNAVQSAPTIVTMAKVDVMTIKAEIAEADVREMRAGLPVQFSLLGALQSYPATLESIDPAPKEISDSDSLTSSTAIYYYGHIDVENKDDLLRYGMTATVSIEVERVENALLVPMTALQTAPDGSDMVQVLEGTNAVPRKVEVGIDDGVYAQILSGLAEGDDVVISASGAAGNAQMPGPPRMF